MKAERNKTIDFLPEDAPEYLARCLRVTEDVPLDAVCGRTICGDTFQVAPHLPRAFADLLIVDPPYNLTKDFSGGGFRRTTDANYAAFTRAWIELLLPLLKPDASVYVCCDWRSSPVIGMTLKDYFRLQNRITWQREKGRGAQRNWKNGMEDIWFATRTDDYTFHVDAVKVRRRVRAPYRADGRPKDWEETPDGKFRNTCPSNFWDDISVPYWSMPENTAHPTQKPEKLMAKLILASSDPGGMRVLRTIARLYKEYRPLSFFGLFAALFGAAGLILFIPVLAEFFRTGLVPRFPTLIVSGVMMTFALLLLVCGFILDTVAKKHRQLFEINLNLLRLTHDKETR